MGLTLHPPLLAKEHLSRKVLHLDCNGCHQSPCFIKKCENNVHLYDSFYKALWTLKLWRTLSLMLIVISCCSPSACLRSYNSEGDCWLRLIITGMVWIHWCETKGCRWWNKPTNLLANQTHLKCFSWSVSLDECNKFTFLFLPTHQPAYINGAQWPTGLWV